MFRVQFLFLIVIGILISSCQSNSKTIKTPELFGPNIISSDFPEFALSINKSQNRVFFNRTTKDRTSMKIMVSNLQDGQWSMPESLSFSTGEFRDVDPFLTEDEKRLYFSSTRPKNPNEKPGVYNTWFVKKNKNQWSDPILAAPPLNSDSTEIFVSIAKNGNAYFVSERTGKRGIFKSKMKKGKYQPVEPVILTLNAREIYASNPAISNDESFLIVAARDAGGNPDLYVSFYIKERWSPLQNLGPRINSIFAEFAPGLSKDQKTLFFSSERPGIVDQLENDVRPPGDIYRVSIHQLLKDLKKNVK